MTMRESAGTAANPVGGDATAPLLRVERLSKRFGEVLAVDEVSMDVGRGEFFALLGASGCGKTTLLRMLAGLERPSSGRIMIDGEDMTELPPYARPVNMMFQSYALFPHMTVAQNIAFGLRQERMGRGRIREIVNDILELVQLAPFAGRKPDQLSGGQRQRVALARSLAKRPKLLLLDEPLGALDRKLREATQFELMNLQERTGTTFVMVTHDQEEAMAMSGRIAVMDAGRIAQIGTPTELYERPASRSIAGFIGAVNLFDGVVAGYEEGVLTVRCDALGRTLRIRHHQALACDTTVAVAVRPEKILVTARSAVGDNRVEGTVTEYAYLGDVTIYHVAVAGGMVLQVQLTNSERGARLRRRDPVSLSWSPDAGVVLTG